MGVGTALAMVRIGAETFDRWLRAGLADWWADRAENSSRRPAQRVSPRAGGCVTSFLNCTRPWNASRCNTVVKTRDVALDGAEFLAKLADLDLDGFGQSGLLARSRILGHAAPVGCMVGAG